MDQTCEVGSVTKIRLVLRRRISHNMGRRLGYAKMDWNPRGCNSGPIEEPASHDIVEDNVGLGAGGLLIVYTGIHVSTVCVIADVMTGLV